MNCAIGAAAPPTVTHSATVAQNSMNVCRSATVENTAGITVPGSESNQKFYTTSDFTCEASEIIVFTLKGKTKNEKITEPVTVDCKPTCVTCGRTNRATNKFCAECGTSLQIF